MSDDFEIIWQVEDGYVNNGPHRLIISSDAIDEEMSDKELSDVFADAIEEDFRQNASWTCDQETEFIAWAKEQIAKMKETE